MSNELATRPNHPAASRRLRYDRVDSTKPGAGLGLSLVLGMNRGDAPASTADRRASERRELDGFVCRVGWRQWLRVQQQDVLIVNISRGGALVFLDEAPPRRRLWLELETPRRRALVPATVLDVRRTRLGQAAVRLKFAQRWPYDLFEAAVCGLPPVDPRSRAAGARRGREGETPRDRSDA